MAFLRKRGGSHQLIETYREDGKVKQRVLANLGHLTSVPEAIASMEKRLRSLECLQATEREHLKAARRHLERWKKHNADLRRRGISPDQRVPEQVGWDYLYPRYSDPLETAEEAKRIEAELPLHRAEREARYKAMGFSVDDMEEYLEGIKRGETTVKVSKTYRQIKESLAKWPKRIEEAKRELKALKACVEEGAEVPNAISILKDHETELKKLGVRSLSVFGSTARGEATSASDVDVAVKLAAGPRGFARLERIDAVKDRLSSLLSRPVDVVEEPARSPRIQKAIERDRVVAF